MRATIDDPDVMAGVTLLSARGHSNAEIADAFGVSSRTIRRWRSLLGISSTWSPSPAPCGTNAAYSSGCRCTDCRAAHTELARAYRRRVAYARWRRPMT